MGDGWFGEGYPGDVDGWEPPLIAARCEDERTARSAALAGSRACSISDLSWLGCIYVGEAFFWLSKNSFLVENFRDRPPDWLDEGVCAGGEMAFCGS